MSEIDIYECIKQKDIDSIKEFVQSEINLMTEEVFFIFKELLLFYMLVYVVM